jgi:acetate kinase
MVALGGVDIIALGGRLINYLPRVRKSLFEEMHQFGIILDPDRNLQLGDDMQSEISSASSKVKLYYIKHSIRCAIHAEVLKVLS